MSQQFSKIIKNILDSTYTNFKCYCCNRTNAYMKVEMSLTNKLIYSSSRIKGDNLTT